MIHLLGEADDGNLIEDLVCCSAGDGPGRREHVEAALDLVDAAQPASKAARRAWLQDRWRWFRWETRTTHALRPNGVPDWRKRARGTR